eukprot:365946-Chlamydomonas_euryale.AAC.8
MHMLFGWVHTVAWMWKTRRACCWLHTLSQLSWSDGPSMMTCKFCAPASRMHSGCSCVCAGWQLHRGRNRPGQLAGVHQASSAMLQRLLCPRSGRGVTLRLASSPWHERLCTSSAASTVQPSSLVFTRLLAAHFYLDGPSRASLSPCADGLCYKLMQIRRCLPESELQGGCLYRFKLRSSICLPRTHVAEVGMQKMADINAILRHRHPLISTIWSCVVTTATDTTMVWGKVMVVQQVLDLHYNVHFSDVVSQPADVLLVTLRSVLDNIVYAPSSNIAACMLLAMRASHSTWLACSSHQTCGKPR